MKKQKITPEVASLVVRKIGLISNSDRYYLEEALRLFESGMDVDTATSKMAAERLFDLYGEEYDI